jgi:hypothetical protein
VLLAGLLLANAGCLVVAGVTGAALGGAALAGYIWANNALYHDYPASLVDSVAAVRTALQELHFPILDEKPGTGEVLIVTRTTDDSAVKIRLEVVHSRIPAEGPMTRIAVRVGFRGDEAVSRAILDRVSLHLTAVPPVYVGSGISPVAPALGPPVAAAPPGPARTTAEPPVLPTAPVPINAGPAAPVAKPLTLGGATP